MSTCKLASPLNFTFKSIHTSRPTVADAVLSSNSFHQSTLAPKMLLRVPPICFLNNFLPRPLVPEGLYCATPIVKMFIV